MDEELSLTVLKQDLKTPLSEEPYLCTLSKNAKALMKRMGVQDGGSMDYQYTIKHHMTFLYRKRVSSEMIMPRLLCYELNNLLFSQKARG